MTEFDYFPIKKIIIHEINRYEEQEFVELFVHPQGRISWCDGVLFDFIGMGATPEIFSLQLKGTYHWAALQFCKSSKYQKKITNRDVNYELRIVDCSGNPVFQDMIKWLKEQSIWNDEDVKDKPS